MNRRLFTRGAAAGLAVLACLLPATAAGAARAPGSSFSGELTGVSCPAADDCWAVGSVNNGGHAQIAHWDGSTWTQVPLERPRTGTTSLNSVSCPSVSLCWAAGTWNVGSEGKSYLVRWNGTRWTAEGPDIGGTPKAVFCASTSDCWVAGGVKMEHWNGNRWAAVPAPAVFHDAFRPGLYCVSSSDCWMTATKLNQHGVVIGHWNGRTWQTVRNPASTAHDVSLPGLSCPGATTCIAAGGVAVSWNGSRWARADAGLTATLNAVSCTVALACLGVGSGSGSVASSERWDGSQWHPVTTPAPSGTNSQLNAISCVTASDCWSVGDQFSETTTLNLIEQWNGSKWSVFS